MTVFIVLSPWQSHCESSLGLGEKFSRFCSVHKACTKKACQTYKFLVQVDLYKLPVLGALRRELAFLDNMCVLIIQLNFITILCSGIPNVHSHD